METSFVARVQRPELARTDSSGGASRGENGDKEKNDNRGIQPVSALWCILYTYEFTHLARAQPLNAMCDIRRSGLLLFFETQDTLTRGWHQVSELERQVRTCHQREYATMSRKTRPSVYNSLEPVYLQTHEKYERELAIANRKIKDLQNECKCVFFYVVASPAT